MNETVPVITIDGPSGVGKGTLAAWLAGELGWHLLDSGALYRLTALSARRHGVALDDEAALARLAAGLDVVFDTTPAGQRVLLEGDEVGRAIRTEAIGNDASRVAVQAAVRQALLQRQRDFRRPPGLVADGRDMGTVVFPDAPLKLFLGASPEARARRRHKQLMEHGNSASLAGLAQEIAERDARDARRATAPLRPAADAIHLDTTDLTVTDVRARTRTLVAERLQL